MHLQLGLVVQTTGFRFGAKQHGLHVHCPHRYLIACSRLVFGFFGTGFIFGLDMFVEYVLIQVSVFSAHTDVALILSRYEHGKLFIFEDIAEIFQTHNTSVGFCCSCCVLGMPVGLCRARIYKFLALVCGHITTIMRRDTNSSGSSDHSLPLEHTSPSCGYLAWVDSGHCRLTMKRRFFWIAQV